MEVPEKITIVMADDHPLFRKGLRDAIEPDGRFQVVGEAGDGETALELIGRLLPRVAILDVEMPKMTGLDVAREIHKNSLPVSVIMLTMYDEEEMFRRAMDLGVIGYIVKDSAAIEIVRGIVTVAMGEYFVSPVLTSGVLQHYNVLGSQTDSRLGLHRLTQTERRILRLIAADKSTKEIAAELNISHRTAEHHRANICSKLGLSGHYALVRFALEHKSTL